MIIIITKRLKPFVFSVLRRNTTLLFYWPALLPFELRHVRM